MIEWINSVIEGDFYAWIQFFFQYWNLLATEKKGFV